MSLITIGWVALGGASGSIARYLISGGLNDRFHPWGTVLVNVVGSFVLGVLLGRWGMAVETPNRVGLTAGLLGGFTTFSAFTLDTVRLWENGQMAAAAVTVLASVSLGLAGAVLGVLVGRA